MIELSLNTWVLLIGWSFIILVLIMSWLVETLTGEKIKRFPEWLQSLLILDLVIIFTFAVKQLLSCQ